jgi:hypothetical protein
VDNAAFVLNNPNPVIHIIHESLDNSSNPELTTVSTLLPLAFYQSLFTLTLTLSPQGRGNFSPVLNFKSSNISPLLNFK